MRQNLCLLTCFLFTATGCGLGIHGMPDEGLDAPHRGAVDVDATSDRSRPSSKRFPNRRARNADPIVSRTSQALMVEPIDSENVESVITDELFGPGIEVTNLQYSGNLEAIGTFSYDGDDLGLDEGLVLSTGHALSSMGPNEQSQVTTQFYTVGDADLEPISGYTTFDAATIEFDFETASQDLFALEFVLGSEEYPEFIGSMFSDAFAVFISENNTDVDPNIGETAYNIARMANIANVDCDLVEDQITLWDMTPNTNPCLYIDNCSQTNDDELVDVYANLDGAEIEYDGLTRPLQLKIPVQPFVSYHLKIVIADGADAKFDTGVFIQSGSFRGATKIPAGPMGEAPFASKLR